ncbi:MAG: hypothetical protein WCE83_02305 [Candidatus Baltobacteraceae bacterium]
MAVPPDGRRAVSGSHDNTLKVCDLETGTAKKYVLLIDVPGDLAGHAGRVNLAAPRDRALLLLATPGIPARRTRRRQRPSDLRLLEAGLCFWITGAKYDPRKEGHGCTCAAAGDRAEG